MLNLFSYISSCSVRETWLSAQRSAIAGKESHGNLTSVDLVPGQLLSSVSACSGFEGALMA
jgi:hypothetical protein